VQRRREMTFHFGQLIAHLCKTRSCRAGSYRQRLRSQQGLGARLFVHRRSGRSRRSRSGPRGAVHAVRRHDPDRDGARRAGCSARSSRRWPRRLVRTPAARR
jgi:hypothetical protein